MSVLPPPPPAQSAAASFSMATHDREVTLWRMLMCFRSTMMFSAFGAAYNETRRFAVPVQTSITGIFDFSDDLSEPFDAPRRAYTSLNPAFAEAFHAMNRARVWDLSSSPAIRALRHRGIVMALLLVVIVIVVFHEEITRLLGW